MAKILLGTTTPNGFVSSGVLTEYVNLGNAGLDFTSFSEAYVQTPWRSPGTFNNLYVRVTANSEATPSTVRFRKNTANGNQIVSITASTTGEFQDSTNTDAAVSGDLVNYSFISTSGSITITAISTTFAATSNTTIKFLSAGQNNIATSNITRYLAPSGSMTFNATESTQQFKCKTTATIANLIVYVYTNAITTPMSVGTRKNTANGNLSISVPTTTTGIFEDLTHTDSLVSGDLFNYYVTTQTGAAGTTLVGVDFTTTNNKSHIFCGGSTVFVTAATTVYYPVAGASQNNTTESIVQLKTNFAHVASNLECFLQANSVTAASTVTFRKNAGNGNQTISIGSSASGYFEDAVNTDTLNSTDEIDYQVVAGGTGAHLNFCFAGYLVSISGTATKWQTCCWSYPV